MGLCGNFSAQPCNTVNVYWVCNNIARAARHRGNTFLKARCSMFLVSGFILKSTSRLRLSNGFPLRRWPPKTPKTNHKTESTYSKLSFHTRSVFSLVLILYFILCQRKTKLAHNVKLLWTRVTLPSDGGGLLFTTSKVCLPKMLCVKT